MGNGIAAIGNGGYNSWIMDDDSDDSDCGGLYKPTPMNKSEITYCEVAYVLSWASQIVRMIRGREPNDTKHPRHWFS